MPFSNISANKKTMIQVAFYDRVKLICFNPDDRVSDLTIGKHCPRKSIIKPKPILKKQPKKKTVSFSRFVNIVRFSINDPVLEITNSTIISRSRHTRTSILKKRSAYIIAPTKEDLEIAKERMFDYACYATTLYPSKKVEARMKRGFMRKLDLDAMMRSHADVELRMLRTNLLLRYKSIDNVFETLWDDFYCNYPRWKIEDA